MNLNAPLDAWTQAIENFSRLRSAENGELVQPDLLHKVEDGNQREVPQDSESDENEADALHEGGPTCEHRYNSAMGQTAAVAEAAISTIT